MTNETTTLETPTNAEQTERVGFWAKHRQKLPLVLSIIALLVTAWSLYTAYQTHLVLNELEESAGYTEQLVRTYGIHVDDDGNFVTDANGNIEKALGVEVYTDNPANLHDVEAGNEKGGVTYYPLHMYED